MITFLTAMTGVTILFAMPFFHIKNKVVSRYRGALFIMLSSLYFLAFFIMAYLVRDKFQ